MRNFMDEFHDTVAQGLEAMTPSPDYRALLDMAVEAEVASAEIEWSYHEDNHRCPRDFWHVRLTWRGFNNGWAKYGEQEQRVLPESVKTEAEADMRAELRSAISSTLVTIKQKLAQK